MLSFSLLQRPRFEQNLGEILSYVSVNALIAFIITWSHRFCQADNVKSQSSDQADTVDSIPPPKCSYRLAL